MTESIRLSRVITEYLSVGGLFNPELMEHEKVRDLLIECRTEISRIPKLEKCVALLSSMVVCGERHSDTSQKVVNEAMS